MAGSSLIRTLFIVDCPLLQLFPPRLFLQPFPLPRVLPLLEVPLLEFEPEAFGGVSQWFSVVCEPVGARHPSQVHLSPSVLVWDTRLMWASDEDL